MNLDEWLQPNKQRQIQGQTIKFPKGLDRVGKSMQTESDGPHSHGHTYPNKNKKKPLCNATVVRF